MTLSLRRTFCFLALSAFTASLIAYSQSSHSSGASLKITASDRDGSYMIGTSDNGSNVIRATAAAKINGKWLHVSDYLKYVVSTVSIDGQAELGSFKAVTIRYTGLIDQPDLIISLRTYNDVPYGEIQLTAHNGTGTAVEIQAFRLLETQQGKKSGSLVDLGGPAATDRVLSDSFSEDRPAIQLRDLNDVENHVHRAVGSQLVYNRQSKQSWFIGALTSDKFLSILRLHMTGDKSTAIMSSYEVDSTGTTELLTDNSLQDSPAQDRIELSLPVPPGAELSSERMLFSVSDDYHDQLETYARLVRELHHARVSAPTPLGWWSWTAYYFGLNEDTALTNAKWLSQNLKSYGYTFFHMDEGYQFARGEYATPDSTLFPHGVAALERKVMNEGLVPGIWTAPFEVSERSWVYTHHPEWLVKNAQGQPIHLGLVTDGVDHLYALDTTHPDAQAYLRATYSTLVNAWGIRYIKLDFMEDSAVEGFYHQPHTTALEAQRIGIKTIREAVGEDVLLDKDGCELLNPVGLVDMGRISQDTGHTFSSSKDSAPGIAARYYMNRSYFLADPDAFSVSTQSVDDQNWHGGSKALTLDEAKVSIALSAVSGGLYEIGDDLPTLGESPARLALVQNHDLIDMARLGRASTPLDLMSYRSEDQQPSLFLLKETPRQSILTIFNWTDTPRTHDVNLSQIGLKDAKLYNVTSTLDASTNSKTTTNALQVTLPPHSVRVLKIVNPSISPSAPKVIAHLPTKAIAGESISFTATPASSAEAIVQYTWDFGDGVTAVGRTTSHAYTHGGTFPVRLIVAGVEGTTSQTTAAIIISGAVSTKYHPEQKRRFE